MSNINELEKVKKILSMPVRPPIVFEQQPTLNTGPKFVIKKSLRDKFDDDWSLIISAFKKHKNANNSEQNQTNSDRLLFASREEEVAFFKSMAELGLQFFAQEYKNGAPQDFYLFSCGDKQLYSGNLNQITNTLQNVVKDEPNNKAAIQGLKFILSYQQINYTQFMRQQLKEHKGVEVEQREHLTVSL